LGRVLDVWNDSELDKASGFNLMGLAAASSLVPLTADQYRLASKATHIGFDTEKNTLLYPARYYASYDTSAAQPTHVNGWVDAWTLTTTANTPQASSMVPLTADQYANRATGPQGVQNGALVEYTQPKTVEPLKDQAEDKMTWITSQASLANVMGEAFTDAMKTYVKAIQAIASGADTTSTALPVAPSVVMA